MTRRSIVAILLMASIFTTISLGCGETVKPEKAAPGEAPPKVETPQTFAIGDTIKAGDVQVILHGVRTSAGGQFDKPTNGVFVIAEATIENISEKAYHASSLMQWSVVDEDGVKYSEALLTGLKGSLGGEIGPGRKLRGEIGFDVEKGKNYEVIFEPEALGSGQVIWDVGEVK